MTARKINIGLALGGGSARGLVHIGVLKSLKTRASAGKSANLLNLFQEENRIKPHESNL